MIVDPDFLDHWRTGMVANAIQDQMAPVYLLRLWAHCQERKSDRFVMPTQGLKAQCKFPGDAQVFEAALIEAGFIERDGNSVFVCGWAEKNASLLAAWENGAKGGRPPKAKPTENQTETHGKPRGNQEQTHGEPESNPGETDKRREEKKEEHTSAEPTAKGLPSCPVEDIVALYHELLPSLPRVRMLKDGRRGKIRDTWRWVLTSKRPDGARRAKDGAEAMEWFGSFFTRANENDFLMGRVGRKAGHENWQCDLDFLLTERGMKHVIEKTEVAA